MNVIFNAQKKKKIKNQSIKLLFKEGETGILHGIAMLFISTILSNKGQYKYMQQKRSKHGKCLIVQFRQFDLQCDCCFIQCQAFRSLYRSFKVFSPFLAMAEVAQDVGKVIVQMGTIKFCMTNRMWYWYFVDFKHGISVFASFCYGLVVLGTPKVPLLKGTFHLPEQSHVQV